MSEAVGAVGRLALTFGGYYLAGPLGAVAGSLLGNYLFPVQLADVQGPRISELNIQRGTVGAPITIVYGTKRVGGNIIFASDLIEEAESEEQGGKGGGPSQTVTTYSYFVDLRIGLCDGEDGRPSKPQGIRRIWAYGDLIYDRSPQGEDETDQDYAERLATTEQTDALMTIYPGDEDQTTSALIESYKGVGNVPAYRGLYSVEFERFPLNKYGKTIPQFTFEVYTGTPTEEDCTQYSAGNLEPWAFQLDAGVLDPRNPNNLHLYGYTENGGNADTTFSAALAEMDSANDHPDQGFVVGEVPQEGDSIYIHGWSESGSSNDIQPCDDSPPILDYVGVEMEINTVRSISRACADEVGGNDCTAWWNFLGGKGNAIHVSSGAFSGFVVAVNDGQDPAPYFGGVPFTSSDSNLVLNNCSVSGNLFDLWRLQTHSLGVRRSIEPPDPCAYGTPISEAPGFCIVDGQVTRSLTWTSVSGTFKCLQAYDDTGGGAGATVTAYPVDPCLPLGDENYNDQGFWEAAYAEALANGEPIASGLTYGVDYPVVIFDAFLGECSAPAVIIECVPMSSIVADICDRAGLDSTQIDVTGLTTCVPGYGIGRQMSARDALSPMRMYGLWDCVESADVLVFVERAGAIATTLTNDDLAVHEPTGNDPPSLVEVNRIQEKDLPRRVRLHYEDIDHNHEPGEQSASRISTEATNELDIELAVSMPADEAAQLAEILLYDFWTSRNSYRLQVNNGHSRLEPTDVIEIPVDDQTHRVRILASERALGGIIRLECVRDDDGDYVSTAVPTEHDPTGPQSGDSDVLVCPSEMVLLDIPRLRDADMDAGYYAAIYGTCDTWECAAVYRSLDGGLTYSRIARTSRQATVGEILEIDATGLPFEAPNLDDSPIPYDTVSSIQVQLSTLGRTLSSVTDEQILAGANSAAIGIHGRWVIIQYKTATLVSGDIWVLTDILWGLNETIQNVGSTVSGDSFVALNENLLRLSEDCDNVGATRQLKVVSCGEAVDDVEAQDFTTQGLSCERTCPSTVISASIASPPESNADGDAYLLPDDTGLEGAWFGHGGEIAHWSAETDSWIFCTPASGTIVTILDEIDDTSGGHVISGGDGTYTAAPWASTEPTYLTQLDERGTLPNSLRLTAGIGISLTPSTDGELVIDAVGDTSDTGGALSLDDLSDVQITSPAEDDLLVYDGTSGLWVNPGGLSQVIDTLVDSPARGDILYRNATVWTRLPAGTAGRLLKTNGAGADPSWTPISAVSGTMTFQGSSTVTGAAATDLTISGLDLDAYGIIYFEIQADNGSVSTADFSLYFNSDTTATNYHEERITGQAGGGGNTGGNNGIMSSPTTGQSFTTQAWVRRNFDGFPRTQFIVTRGAASARIINYGWHFYDTSTNVTGITLHSSVASALSIGSVIKVWAISTT